jgi:hypothetical protein
MQSHSRPSAACLPVHTDFLFGVLLDHEGGCNIFFPNIG